MSLATFFSRKRLHLPETRAIRWLRPPLFVVCFALALPLSIPLHLNLAVTKRILSRTVTDYLTRQLVGSVDLGRIDRLDAETIWFSGVAVYDPQFRRVATIDRLHVKTRTYRALWDLLTSNDKLTVVVDSVWAEGVAVRLLGATAEANVPSLIQAFELEPSSVKARPAKPSRPYRVALTDVRLNGVVIENQLSALPVQRARFKQLAGLVLITPEGAAVSVKQFGMRLSEVLHTELAGVSSLEFRTPDHVWGQFNITLGAIPFAGRVDYRAERLEFSLDAPKVTPEQAKSLMPEWPLSKTVSLSLSAHGPLSALGTRVTASVEQTELELVGTTNLSKNFSGEYGLSGHRVDLSAFFGDAVSSDLSLRARVVARLTDGKLELRTDGLVDPGHVLSQPTPVIDFDGQMDAEGLLFGLRSRDPNLPLRAGLWMRGNRVELDAQVSRVRLAPLLEPFAVRGVDGIASLRGRARLEGGRLEVEATSTIESPRLQELAASHLDLQTSFSGPLRRPLEWRGHARLDAERVASPYFSFPALQLEAQGTPKRVQLHLIGSGSQDSRIALDTELFPETEPAVELKGTRLTMHRGTHHLEMGVGSVAIGRDLVKLSGLTLAGTVGVAHGDMEWRSRGAAASLNVERLELGVLGEFLGLPPHRLAGNVTASLEVDARDFDHALGSLDIDFDDLTLGWLTRVSGRWQQTITERAVAGHLEVKSDLIDTISSDYDVSLSGPLDRAESFYGATGRAELAMNQLRLDQIGPLLGALPRPITTTGTVNARLTLERADSQALPNLMLAVASEDLGLRVARDDGKFITFEHASLLGSATYDGATNQIKTDWVLSQYQHPRAKLGFETTLDLTAFLVDPKTALGSLYDLPFDAWVQIPRQSLAELGPIFGTSFGVGEVESKVWLKGPLVDPHLVVDLQGKELKLVSLGNQTPIDVEGLVEFAHKNGETRVLLGLGKGGTTWATLNAVGTVFATHGAALRTDGPRTDGPRTDGPRKDGPRKNPWNYDWDGRIELGLTGLPLSSLPFAEASRVDGSIRGGATVTRSRGMTHLDVLVPIDNLQIQARPVGQSLFSMRSDGKELAITAKLIDGGALVDLEAALPMDFRPPLPRPRRGQPLRLTAHATGYDAGILGPFVSGYLGKVEGELSGDLEATYDFGSGEDDAILALGGNAKLRRGRARIEALGLNVSEIALDAIANSTGSRTVIHVPTFTAAVGTNQENLKATVVLELERLDLQRLNASIERLDKLPLIVDGVSLAELTGNANLQMVPLLASASAPKKSGYLMDLAIGELEVKLPRREAHQIVTLAENPDIAVLQPLSHAAYQRTQPSASTTLAIRLDLGRKSRVTRNDFTLPIAGTPAFVFEDELRPSGSIRLEAGGRLQLMGKTFVIQQGQVTLNPEEATNPRFEVVAEWRGPTHIVTATVSGTPKEASLHLASDPPLANESQVMALLLSGSGGDASTTGIGVGASIFQEFVSETPLSSLELRTSQDEQHANYTAAVPLKENLWFEGTYQNATNNGLSATTSREGFSGTVDWRFHKNWSLRTEVGTLGAGADVLWQYRY